MWIICTFCLILTKCYFMSELSGLQCTSCRHLDKMLEILSTETTAEYLYKKLNIWNILKILSVTSLKPNSVSCFYINSTYHIVFIEHRIFCSALSSLFSLGFVNIFVEIRPINGDGCALHMWVTVTYILKFMDIF